MRQAVLTVGGALFALAACSSDFSGVSATGGKPMGAASTAPSAASQMPQPANSLPAGAAVNAPVSPKVGTVGTTAY